MASVGPGVASAKKMQGKSARNIQGWEAALCDAREALRQCRSHTRALKRSIRVIEEKIQTGVPFPVMFPRPRTRSTKAA